jgi:hypothetical protein
MKRLLKKICERIQPKKEDLTYDEFIRLEGKKFSGQKPQEDSRRNMYIRPRDW